MKSGYLSEYFEAVAAKRLKAVEADLVRSNQHEFNGVGDLKRILGQPTGKVRIPARFMYLNDHDDEPVVGDGIVTWYDARERHPTRSECRLYFPTTPVSLCAAEGDLLVIGKRRDGNLLVLIAENGSTIERQIEWLFGFTDLAHPGFSVRGELESDQFKVEFAARLILEELGIEIEERDESMLDVMLYRFGGRFPPTRSFSAFAREMSPGVVAADDPDGALMAWVEREEILFRTLERYMVAERLSSGFGQSVDDFVGFSLSVQNRRKSRAGSALENHLEELFDALQVRNSRGQPTENNARPDFVFPGISEYRDHTFPADRLTMLGAKATCKDRWRQVLAEADRIPHKHLVTLEPGISENQTAEMRSKALTLVLPVTLHETYTPRQQLHLLTLGAFVELVRARDRAL